MNDPTQGGHERNDPVSRAPHPRAAAASAGPAGAVRPGTGPIRDLVIHGHRGIGASGTPLTIAAGDGIHPGVGKRMVALSTWVGGF
ncbi:hypothetical protein Pta02_78290 [Planobispora takensis]|uniref:Uncharacterized protein n=1 Tax=Planobispora takensis TaxID=1367882 RepID=A0A8J3T7F7_9ACTN|nr:hypothetical protein Pta02_78290 [Planobispora takensis]